MRRCLVHDEAHVGGVASQMVEALETISLSAAICIDISKEFAIVTELPVPNELSNSINDAYGITTYFDVEPCHAISKLSNILERCLCYKCQATLATTISWRATHLRQCEATSMSANYEGEKMKMIRSNGSI